MSNVGRIERFWDNLKKESKKKNKFLRIIVNAPWYVTNDTLHDLNVH